MDDIKEYIWWYEDAIWDTLDNYDWWENEFNEFCVNVYMWD